MLLLYFVAAGLVLGRLAGGRFGHLGEVRFDWWPVALGGLAFQVVLFSEPLGSRVGNAGPVLYVLSTVVVMAALLRNLRLYGFPVIALGAGLNLAAILLNGGLMPADPAAFAALTGQPVVPTDLFSNSVIVSSDAPLAYLGDTLVLPRPMPFANVFSIGDVAIGLGAVIFITVAMRAPARATDGVHVRQQHRAAMAPGALRAGGSLDVDRARASGH